MADRLDLKQHSSLALETGENFNAQHAVVELKESLEDLRFQALSLQKLLSELAEK